MVEVATTTIFQLFRFCADAISYPSPIFISQSSNRKLKCRRTDSTLHYISFTHNNTGTCVRKFGLPFLMAVTFARTYLHVYSKRDRAVIKVKSSLPIKSTVSACEKYMSYNLINQRIKLPT